MRRTPGDLSTPSDLFSSATPTLALHRSFTTAKRIAIDSTSWVEIVPGWLSGAQLLLETLRSTVPWQQRDRRLFDQTFREPRMTAEYRTLAAVRNRTLLDCVRTLSDHYGVVYDSLWLNRYRDEQDSTGWHRDR